jgi:hypothetical protein
MLLPLGAKTPASKRNRHPEPPGRRDADNRHASGHRDVFRALTTAAVALANGASRIVMVRSVEDVLGLRDVGIGQICFSRRATLPLRGQVWATFAAGHRPASVSATFCSHNEIEVL